MKNKAFFFSMFHLNRIVFCLILTAISTFSRAEGDFAISSEQLQQLLGPTLNSVRVQISSTSGNISVRLPNGYFITRPVSVPPFEAGPMTCTLQPIESTGAPTFSYRDGIFRFSLRLRPANSNLLVRTSGIWPNVTATTVQIDVSFRLGLLNGNVVAESLSTVVTGNIDLTGIGAPFSPVVRPEITRQMAIRIQEQLTPHLNLALQLIVSTYVAQASGYGASLRISAPIRHEVSRVVFTITGNNQTTPRPQILLTGIDPSLINIDALKTSPSWQGTQFLLSAPPTTFAPGSITPLIGTNLGNKINSADNLWSFKIIQQTLLEKGATGVAVSIEVVNLDKAKRTLLDSGFSPYPMISDANGNPNPKVDGNDASVNFYGRIFGPGETATLVLYFYYASGIYPKMIAPEVLSLPHVNKSASLTFRLK